VTEDAADGAALDTDERGTGPDGRRLDRPALFADYLVRTRWFGGKGRTFSVTGVTRIGEIPGRLDNGPHVVVHLVEVTYRDHHGETELYQVPLAFYAEPQGRLDHAFVGWWEEEGHGWMHAYDALHDHEAMACWLRSFHRAADEPVSDGSLTFHRLPGYELDADAQSALFTGEQSNSSVAFGEDSIMKVFRKITPGINPDVAVHEVLTLAGSEHIAALYGWLEAVDPASGEPMHLAMLQRFLRTATDGWEFALASVRTLFAEPEVHPHHSGGDFAGEATRLGEAVASIHRHLAESFPTEHLGPEATASLAQALIERLDHAVRVVPELAEHAPRLREVFEEVAELDGIEVQRVHGDLHLGQTLRTSLGWKIVDFEGEPARPLAERLRPDSRWRDVAGMLRSFDYAPHAVINAATLNPQTGSLQDLQRAHEQLVLRAAEWANRARNHFLMGYTSAGDASVAAEELSAHRVLLDAYVADKAVYEAVYETRNRPTWVGIPLQAIARLTTS